MNERNSFNIQIQISVEFVIPFWFQYDEMLFSLTQIS